MRKYNNNHMLILVGLATAVVAFTVYANTNTKYSAGTKEIHFPDVTVTPIQKSLYEEIENSQDRDLIEDIKNVAPSSGIPIRQIEKVTAPVSFYDMPPMEFNVRYNHAALLRNAPRCELPANRSITLPRSM